MAKKKTEMIKVTLVRSSIGKPEKHKKTLEGLGLKKVNRSVLRQDTPSIRGMVNQVSHLVTVESMKG